MSQTSGFKLVCGLPCVSDSQSQGSSCSRGLRVTSIAVAVLTVITGVLILQNIIKCNQSNYVGWGAISFGIFLSLCIASVKCEKAVDALKKPDVEGSAERSTEKKKEVESTPPENQALIARKKELTKLFTQEMVDALGGIDALMMLPEISLADWNGVFNQELIKRLPGSVVWGMGNKHPFIVFLYTSAVESGAVQIEMLSRTNDGWKGESSHPVGEFVLRKVGHGTIQDRTVEAGVMLKRIGRFVRGEAVGVMLPYQKHKDPKNRIVIHTNLQAAAAAPFFFGAHARPEDRDYWRPADSYLKGDELECYMGIEDIQFYERVGSDLHLYQKPV